jgi:hypothetical protein
MASKSKISPRIIFWLVFCFALAFGGIGWRDYLASIPGGSPPTSHHPIVELLKLVLAFILGKVITDVHKTTSHHTTSIVLEQAQILLCVSGALMMRSIGDSLARAFGIAGAASLIRFRTPVEDPKDTIILFLSLGLGMACGLGAFAVAPLGAAFLSVALILLDRMATGAERSSYLLSVTGPEPGLSEERARHVLEDSGVGYETRGVQRQNGQEIVTYRVELASDKSVNQMTKALEASGLQCISWESAKKKKKR